MRKGEWKIKKQQDICYGELVELKIPYCSNCGWEQRDLTPWCKCNWNFCPECGTLMKKEVKE